MKYPNRTRGHPVKKGFQSKPASTDATVVGFFASFFLAKWFKYHMKCGNEDYAVAQNTQRRNLVGEAEATAVGIYAAEVCDTHYCCEKKQQRC